MFNSKFSTFSLGSSSNNSSLEYYLAHNAFLLIIFSLYPLSTNQPSKSLHKRKRKLYEHILFRQRACKKYLFLMVRVTQREDGDY